MRNNKNWGRDSREQTKSDTKSSRNHSEEDKKELREDILEGRNPVLEALRGERTIDKIFVVKGKKEGSILQIIAIAKEKGVVVQEVEKNKLDSMSQTNSHQGVIAFVSEHNYVDVDDILAIASEKNEKPFIVILDEVTDAHNLGSVLRSADASGAHGIIIPKRRAVGLSSVVGKASAGAIEYVPVAKVSNIAQTVEYLKKQGIWIFGADGDGKQTYYECDFKGPLALVIGSEGEGIGRLIKEKCDYLIKIPMKGQISSLNAGVAAGILMFEVVKQRQ